MSKEQQKILRYSQAINTLITNTQTIQNKLNPLFETLKQHLKDNQADMAAAAYQKTLQAFIEGTNDYRNELAKLTKAVAPARLLGSHHSLVTAYRDYVAGCQQMVDSMHDDQTIDIDQFMLAEKQQDAANMQITRCLRKLCVNYD